MSSSASAWPRNRWTFLLIFTVSMAREQKRGVYCGKFNLLKSEWIEGLRNKSRWLLTACYVNNKYTFLSLTSNSVSLLHNAIIVNVCAGDGTYLINQTYIDVYLLPNTYVTLQPFLRPLRNSDINWFAADNKTDLLMSNSMQLGENLTIGPMTIKLHHMRVMYAPFITDNKENQ